MQTSVLDQQPIGVAGQLANLRTEDVGDVKTATNEEASAGIPFGVMVKQGTNDDGVKLLAGSGDAAVMSGIVVFASLYNIPTQLSADGFLQPGVTFDRLREGDIYVIVEDAVTPASPVHVRHTTSTDEQVGGFRGSAVAGKTFTLTSGAKYQSSAYIGDLAVLHIDINELAATADS